MTRLFGLLRPYSGLAMTHPAARFLLIAKAAARGRLPPFPIFLQKMELFAVFGAADRLKLSAVCYLSPRNSFI